MDHILENEGKPVPELQGVSESAAGDNAADDDVDMEAAQAKGIQADAEAKVGKPRSLVSY